MDTVCKYVVVNMTLRLGNFARYRQDRTNVSMTMILVLGVGFGRIPYLLLVFTPFRTSPSGSRPGLEPVWHLDRGYVQEFKKCR